MFTSLNTYLYGYPTLSKATGFLRSIFSASFGFQVAVALLVTACLSLITEKSPSSFLAQILLVPAVGQLPLALLISHFVSKANHRQAFLSATILAGVLLSTPAWFAGMAFLSTSNMLYFFLFLIILMNYYTIGFILCGRWGKKASGSPPVIKAK